MLLQFAVENFLSIREQAVLSMLAPAGTQLSLRYARRVGARWDVLRCAALYGANAAGKSNVVKAFATFRALMAEGMTPGVPFDVIGFRLAPAFREKPTRFEVEVVLSDIRYSYGIELTGKYIVSEWLYRGDGDEERLLFERERGADGAPEHHFTFGEIERLDDEERRYLRFVAKGTQPRQPFLVECRQRNVTEYLALSEWFERGVSVLHQDSKHDDLVSFLEESRAREFVEERLRRWGTGVEGVDVQDDPLSGFGALDEPMIAVLNSTGVSSRRIMFRHAGEGAPESFDWREESDGTQRLMHLLPVLSRVHAGEASGALLVVDELDRSLHTTLTRHFVEEFLDLCEARADSGAQLIFTTHDTNLLNGRLLPPASIWFVEKDHGGASHLYSLAEYPPAQVEALIEHLEDGYLQGRFGAIPFLASREHLAWGRSGTGP